MISEHLLFMGQSGRDDTNVARRLITKFRVDYIWVLWWHQNWSLILLLDLIERNKMISRRVDSLLIKYIYHSLPENTFSLPILK